MAPHEEIFAHAPGTSMTRREEIRARPARFPAATLERRSPRAKAFGAKRGSQGNGRGHESSVPPLTVKLLKTPTNSGPFLNQAKHIFEKKNFRKEVF
jgi:hypothetical protein